MSSNGVIAISIILLHFTEFDSFEGVTLQSLKILTLSAELLEKDRLPLLAQTDQPCSAVTLR